MDTKIEYKFENATAFQTNLKLQPTTGVPDRLRSGTGPTLLQVRVV